MSGIAGMLVRGQNAVEIDSFVVTLTLNTALTANAYRNSLTFDQAIETARSTARGAGFTDEN